MGAGVGQRGRRGVRPVRARGPARPGAGGGSRRRDRRPSRRPCRRPGPRPWRQRLMRIGIDVGGTNTDAVLLDGDRVLTEVKVTTTPDVTGGVVEALAGLRAQSGFDPG